MLILSVLQPFFEEAASAQASYATQYAAWSERVKSAGGEGREVLKNINKRRTRFGRPPLKARSPKGERKPVNSFLRWLEGARDGYEGSVKEKTKEAAKTWNGMSEDEKKVFSRFVSECKGTNRARSPT
jgi:hypothetical protein